MKKIEEIMAEWESDSDVDFSNISQELLKVPKLHKKYLDYSTKHKLLSKQAENQYFIMKRKKWEFYSGKMSKEDLDLNNWKPFQLNILKSDIPMYLESDEDLIKLDTKKKYHELASSSCDAILKEIYNRTFQLREYLQHERFTNGSR